MKKAQKKISAKEFDELFDRGGDVTPYLDLKKAKFQSPIQRINIDIPQEILQKVDREAERVGVPRTSLLKLWIAQHADRLAA